MPLSLEYQVERKNLRTPKAIYLFNKKKENTWEMKSSNVNNCFLHPKFARTWTLPSVTRHSKTKHGRYSQ